MALAKHERVEIPPHCVRVPNGNNVYIHYTLRAYRNEKGQPTSERVSIGKLDSETGMLIPNNRYYELFEKRAPLPMLEYVRDYGVYAAFRGVVSELGLDKLLKKHFPDHAEEMLTVAQYNAVCALIILMLTSKTARLSSDGLLHFVAYSSYQITRMHCMCAGIAGLQVQGF